MLAFIKDKNGIMGLTFSQMGLILVTAILLAVVFSLLFLNNLVKASDMENIGSGFSTILDGMDTRFFENTTAYRFPDKSYDYSVSISTEYITIESKGFFDDKISIKYRFHTKPLIRDNNINWVSNEELHHYLFLNYFSYGNESDPISNDYKDNVLDEIEYLCENISFYYANYPLVLDIEKPVYISKNFIYFDIDNDGIWKKDNDEKYGLLAIYQK